MANACAAMNIFRNSRRYQDSHYTVYGVDFTFERFGLSDLVDLFSSLDRRRPSFSKILLRAYSQKETTRKESRAREDMRYIMLQSSAVWVEIVAL
jgi:hypothetical protein